MGSTSTLPHLLLSFHRSPLQLLPTPATSSSLACSFRRLSVSGSPLRPVSQLRHRRIAPLPRASAEEAGGTEEEQEQQQEEEVDPSTASDGDGEEVLAEAAGEDSVVSLAVLDAEEEQKPPRRTIVKMGDIMGILNQRGIEEAEKVKTVPDVRPGDVLELKVARKGRRRLATYKGVVIARSNAGVHTTIRVRRIIAGNGVEITFAVYSPNVKDIQIIQRRKVRRAKLYYLRKSLPRYCTFK